MDLDAAGLREQPFRTHGRPLMAVSYASQQRALKNLAETISQPNGLCLLQGPGLSGKSTVIRQFADSLTDDCALAIVNGTGLNTAGLLEAVLRQFGYVFEHSSTSELLAMLRVFARQQAASHTSPLLIIENAQDLNPSAMRAVGELAEWRVRAVRAIKLVLVGDQPLLPIVNKHATDSIRIRLTHDFHLRPMSSTEAMEFIYAKLRAAGSKEPESVFPRAVCTELWRASGGWPGILDRVALLALASAEKPPVTVANIEYPALPLGTWKRAPREDRSAEHPTAPTLFVSRDGKTEQELIFDKPRLLIGRSEHNDIAIESRFISRHHALLVRHGKATFLMDLNSTNGTFVNSRRVSNHVLVNDDLIMLGNYRIKFRHPEASARGDLTGPAFADTVIMKTLDDMRRLLAQENTALLPVASNKVQGSDV